jgi:RNA polymerase sigma-70 factor (ECF subfamily)
MGSFTVSNEAANESVIEQVWEDAYKAHSPLLFGYLIKRVGQDLAADIMQEAFLKLLQVMKKGRKIENLKAYLFQIARNELNSEMNRHHFTESADHLVNLKDQNSNVEAEFLKKELEGLLESARQTLSPLELEIFELRWHLGFTQVEIAGVIKKSERQVRRDLEKIVRKIRTIMENGGWNFGDVSEKGI